MLELFRWGICGGGVATVVWQRLPGRHGLATNLALRASLSAFGAPLGRGMWRRCGERQRARGLVRWPFVTGSRGAQFLGARRAR